LDALSDVLRIVRLTGAVFMDAEFTAPWCIGEPSGVEVCVEHMPHAQHVVIYHLVAEGRCEVSVPGQAAASARAGDLIVIPGGDAHSLGSDLSRRPVPGGPLVVPRGPDEVPQVRYGGGGEVTRMVCGYLACDSSLFDTVLAALPRVMVVKNDKGERLHPHKLLDLSRLPKATNDEPYRIRRTLEYGRAGVGLQDL